MDTTTIISLSVGIPSSVVTLITGYWYVQERNLSKNVNRATLEDLPLKINRSISFSQYLLGLKIILDLLKEQRFEPDIILGIHYGGTVVAADLGKLDYIPFKTVDIHYHSQGNKPICDSVIFDFDKEILLRNKKVLIIDNSIRSGRTLQMTYNEVTKYTSNIKTLVLYDKGEESKKYINPDYTIYKSLKPLKTFIK